MGGELWKEKVVIVGTGWMEVVMVKHNQSFVKRNKKPPRQTRPSIEWSKGKKVQLTHTNQISLKC